MIERRAAFSFLCLVGVILPAHDGGFQSPQENGNSFYFPGTLNQAKTQARAEAKLLLLDFVQDSCAGCVRLHEDFFDHASYRAYLAEHFIVFRSHISDRNAAAIWSEYKVVGTPTVVVARPNGDEIDRLLSYRPPAEAFWRRLEEVRLGSHSLERLKRNHSENPDDLALAARLLQKAFLASDLDLAKQLSEQLLARSEEALLITLIHPVHGGGTVPVNALEFAQYTRTLDSPQSVIDFVRKFPDGPLRNSALRNLAWFFDPTVEWSFGSASQRTRELEAAFECALEAHGDSLLLIRTFMQYCLVTNADESMVERALEKARRIVVRGDAAEDPEFVVNYADLLRARGRSKEALDVFNHGFIERYQDLSVVLAAYTRYWASVGLNLKSALWASDRLRSLRPEGSEGWSLHALVLYKLARYEEAMTSANKALQVDPNDEIAKQIVTAGQELLESQKGSAADRPF